MQAEDLPVSGGPIDVSSQKFDRENLSVLFDTLLNISSSPDQSSTLEAIARAAVAMSHATAASIWLLENDGYYTPRIWWGYRDSDLEPIRIAPNEGLLGLMQQTGAAVQTTDFEHQVAHGPDAQTQVARTGTRSVAAVPLWDGSTIIGALYVTQTEVDTFSDPTMRILERLGAFAQIALANVRRFSHVDEELRRLQGYLDAIPQGVIVYDRNGGVTLVNRTLERELGITAGIWASAEGLNRLRFQPLMSRVVRSGYDIEDAVRHVLASGNPEQGILELTGPTATYEVTLTPLNGGAIVEGVIATLRDISTPRELERERWRSSLLTRLLDLSAYLNSNLSQLDLEERVVNAAIELIGARSGAMGVVEGNDLVYRRVRLNGTWTDFDMRVGRGEGTGGHVWETAVPYVANDRVLDPYATGAVTETYGFRRSLVVPVTSPGGTVVATLHLHDPETERDFEQIDVEALQLLANQAGIALENARLNQLKDEFLSIASHELKTPVTSIKGYIQVLQRKLSPESMRTSARYLEVLNRQTDRLTALINDLLDISRIQRGRFHFATYDLDYRALLQRVINDAELLSGSRDVVLHAPEHVHVAGSPERVQQVLVNLLDNAFKYGPDNTPVTITVEEHGDEVATYVCDEGPGLPTDEAEHIFAPYYQVLSGSTRSSGGLGLGLFISRRIIEEHNGRIWLDQDDHTSFCFTLPRA